MSTTYIAIAVIIFIAYFFFFRSSKPKGYSNISVQELEQYIKDKKATLIDVRTAKETKLGMIGKPLQIELGPGMQQKMSSLDKGKKYIVYCRSGKRSAMASGMMAKMGFENVYNLSGGYLAYQSAE